MILKCTRVTSHFFWYIDEMTKSYKLTRTSGGTGVQTPVMTSGLTISAFCQLC